MGYLTYEKYYLENIKDDEDNQVFNEEEISKILNLYVEKFNQYKNKSDYVNVYSDETIKIELEKNESNGEIIFKSIELKSETNDTIDKIKLVGRHTDDFDLTKYYFAVDEYSALKNGETGRIIPELQLAISKNNYNQGYDIIFDTNLLCIEKIPPALAHRGIGPRRPLLHEEKEINYVYPKKYYEWCFSHEEEAENSLYTEAYRNEYVAEDFSHEAFYEKYKKIPTLPDSNNIKIELKNDFWFCLDYEGVNHTLEVTKIECDGQVFYKNEKAYQKQAFIVDLNLKTSLDNEICEDKGYLLDDFMPYIAGDALNEEMSSDIDAYVDEEESTL